MNNPSDAIGGSPSSKEELAALFANLVLQQVNMANLLLGKVPHPETGQPVKDLGAARLFIDHLEMLEIKTKGNLSPEESQLLKQSLMSVRMAYVDAVNEKAEPSKPESPAAPAPAPTATAQPAQPAGAAAPSDPGTIVAPQAEEHPKKFSKKY